VVGGELGGGLDRIGVRVRGEERKVDMRWRVPDLERRDGSVFFFVYGLLYWIEKERAGEGIVVGSKNIELRELAIPRYRRR